MGVPAPTVSGQRPWTLPAVVVSAALLWASHFPLARGWLAWVALVPLLSLVRAEISARKLALAGWLAGLLFFGAAVAWLRLADPRNYYSWPGLATYCSLYVPLALLLIRFLDRRTRLPLVVAVPVIWTALDYLRAHALTGFPWYFLGHTQHAFLPMIQVADLGGAYAVTFLVAAGNTALFELLQLRRRNGEAPTEPCDRRKVLVQVTAVALLLVLALGYGMVRLGQASFAPGPRIALLQGNLAQHIRNAASAPEGTPAAERPDIIMGRHFQRLHDLACAQKPDLIVWPETSHPHGWLDRAHDAPDATLLTFQRHYNTDVQRLARQANTNVLFGLNTEVMQPNNKSRLFNSAVLVRPGDVPAERYDKMHRVPFGEYVPLREQLSFMNVFAPYDFDYSITAGDRFTRFRLGDLTFGVIICYEDSDPTLARTYAGGDEEPPVDFLVNISNDGWFQGSSEHEEHLAICRFRAVECRRAVARAVNMGISALIDGNGRVLRPLLTGQLDDADAWEVPAGSDDGLPVAEWGQYKKVAGVLTAVVPLDGRSSLYAVLGDWLPALCWVVLGAGVLTALFRPLPAKGSTHV